MYGGSYYSAVEFTDGFMPLEDEEITDTVEEDTSEQESAEKPADEAGDRPVEEKSRKAPAEENNETDEETQTGDSGPGTEIKLYA